jgi:hypothetical protein
MPESHTVGSPSTGEAAAPKKRANPFDTAQAIVAKIRGTYSMNREDVIKAELAVYSAVLVNNAVRDLITAVKENTAARRRP